MNRKIDIWWLLVLAIILFVLMRSCEPKPETITKTTVNINKIIDSVKKATIKDIEPVYIDTSKTTVKWLKGDVIKKDPIVYVDKPNENTIQANQYQTTLKSNNASAELQITTTGELLDIKGEILYKEKETTTITTKTVENSGLYIYGTTPINNFTSPEVGVMFQFKNKVGIMGGIQYNSFANKPEIKVGALIKIL